MKLPFLLLSTLATALAAEDFVPLSCNDPPPSTCSTWGDVVGGGTTYTNEVEIPCGQCVKFDVNTQLTFEAGLTILGKLVIEDGQTVDIVTKFVRVEGELDITSSKPVDGVPDVKITLIGTSDVTFTPADVNSGACGGTCGAGKKPVVVAGGKLTINGMPNGAPTWTHLQDVEAGATTTTTNFVPFQEFPTNGCTLGSDGIIIGEDFSDVDNILVGGTRGSFFTFENQVMKLHDRTSTLHGPQIDLRDVLGCIEEDRKYLISFRVRLTKESETNNNDLTQCAMTGEGCLQVKTEWLDGNENRQISTKYRELQSHQTRYGEWFIVAGDLTFSTNNAASTNIYETIRIQGPGAGINMEIDDLVFRLPPEEAFPDGSDVCSDLVTGNGDAELLGRSPFPMFRTNSYTNLYVDEETAEGATNHYFVSTARDYAPYSNYGSNGKGAGMAFNLPVGCAKAGATYRIKAKLRTIPNEQYPNPAGVQIRLKVNRDAPTPDTYATLATCPPSDGQWIECEETFSYDPGWLQGSPNQYRLYFDVDRTVDYHLDDISITAEQGPINKILVDDTVEGKWAEGAEILLTTYSTDSGMHQTRTITSVTPSSSEANMVVLELDETIKRPSTVKDNANYATEVALLNRNILFIAAEDDPNPKHGGHLIVFHTPHIDQQLEGAEFRNFGQAGNLGRYPIHFHLSGDNSGSIVKRNMIRESNQRCVVIHGTHNVNIEENVAFDTFGHCYLLEDGFETGNTFKKNLGAFTKNQPAVDVIPPITGQNNGDESDGSSSTYWITNPDNNFIENVAAGCQMNGFWLELDNGVRGPMSDVYESINPKKTALGQFERNVAHGCHRGFRTYPNGYIPDEKAVFYDLVSYRNRGDGFFFHNSRNLQVQGGLFADNRRGIDIDRCDDMYVDSAEIIGVSEEYSALTDYQNLNGLCVSSDYLVAVEFHLFTREKQRNGATLSNLNISGYKDTGCDMEVAFRFDEEVRMPNFDWWTTASQLTLEDGNEPFNFCQAEEVNVKNAYVTDTDSSLQPAGNGFVGPSTFLADFPRMTTFIDTATCLDKTVEHCYWYCPTCLRTVLFEFDARNTEGYTLKVCDSTDSTKCIEVEEFFDYNDREMDDYRDYERRMFSVALPKGSYNAEVLDRAGNPTWPTFVVLSYEDAQCADPLVEGSITMDWPEVDDVACEELIRNGNADASDTDFNYWVHRNGAGIKLAQGQGIGGTNAFGDIYSKSHTSDGMGVYLDSRCISRMVGSRYEISAYAKLMVGDEQHVCDEQRENCPKVGLRSYNPNTFTQEPVAVMQNENSLTDGYQLIHGTVEITQEMADSGSLLFYVERSVAAGKLMFVDNVSMKLIGGSPDSRAESCTELVSNGDFETGDTRYWILSTGLGIVSGPGGNGFALHMENGKTATHWLETGCMVEGTSYHFEAKFQLISNDASKTVADLDAIYHSKWPRMVVRPYNNGKYKGYGAALVTEMSGTGWSVMSGYRVATQAFATAEKISIIFTNIPSGYDLVVDDVTVTPGTPDRCSA